MLHISALFLFIGLLAAMLGFTGTALGSFEILFFAFPLLLITSYLVRLMRQR